MYPWMAMTGEVFLEFFPAAETDYELTKDVCLFERPVRPAVPAEYYRHCQVVGDIFPASRKYQFFEGALARALSERPRGTGQMHYGDEPNIGYTMSGRGKGGLLYSNGEYDFPHLLFMQYARTGTRLYYEMAEAAARHWMDVDFLRDAENPLYAGGLCVHEVDHRSHPAAGPSHEWVQGFLDYYHLTGDREALEIARAVGGNVAGYMEKGVFKQPGTYQMRELGWGLVALAAIYEETREERYRKAGEVAVSLVEKHIRTFGGLSEVFRFVEEPEEADAPVLPLASYRDSFHSITINGLQRFFRATGDERAKAMFLEQVKAQLDWFNGPNGWAEHRETRYPMLEAFAYGFHLTRDRAYLEAGMRILEFGLTNGELRLVGYDEVIRTEVKGIPVTSRVVHLEPSNAQMLGLTVIPMLCFLQVAEDEGLLGKRLSPFGL
jgi:hypothetical protein